MAKARELRVINEDGAILRWEGPAADTIAKLIAYAAEKMTEAGVFEVPAPQILSGVIRKTTTICGRLEQDTEGDYIIGDEKFPLGASLNDFVPAEIVDDEAYIFRVEVEAIRLPKADEASEEVEP